MYSAPTFSISAPASISACSIGFCAAIAGLGPPTGGIETPGPPTGGIAGGMGTGLAGGTFNPEFGGKMEPPACLKSGRDKTLFILKNPRVFACGSCLSTTYTVT